MQFVKRFSGHQYSDMMHCSHQACHISPLAAHYHAKKTWTNVASGVGPGL